MKNILILLIMSFGLIGCDARKTPKFKRGDIACLFNTDIQVLIIRTRGIRYEVILPNGFQESYRGENVEKCRN